MRMSDGIAVRSGLHVAMVAMATLFFPTVTLHAQQAYPERPVRIIVPSAPGGGTDALARLLAQHLSSVMGQQFFVENRPGASSIVGTEAVARSPADGQTLLFGAATITINHVMYKTLPYDVLRDLAPITQMVSLPNVLVVNATLGPRSLAEFIALARQEPGKLTYGSPGLGSHLQLSMELLKSMAAIDVQHVPYKGVGPAINDLLGGHVGSVVSNVITAKPQIEAGKLRGLGVTGATRSSILSNVQTIAEAGVPGYDLLNWYGFFATAGTPSAIVDRLSREAAQFLKSPAMKEQLALEGAEPVGSTPAEFTAFIKREMDTWKRVAAAAHVEPQ